MSSVLGTASGVAIISQEGRITKVNDAFCRMTGYLQEQLVGSIYFDLVFQPDQLLLKERHIQFFADELSGSFEVRFVCKEGAILMTLVQTTVLLTAGEKPLLILSIVDLTERKRAEQELKARELFYKALLERSADMKILTSESGKIFFASPSITTYLGYSSDELHGKDVKEFVPVEDFAQLSILIDGVIKNHGSSVLIQQRVRHKNGTWRYCEGSVTNLLNDPSVGHIVANFRDISDRRYSAELLRKSETNLRTIFNSIDIGVVLLDLNMEIMQFNTFAAHWSKVVFKDELAKGTNFSSYISTENQRKFCDVFASVVANTIFNAEVSYKNPVGDVLWYHVRMTPVVTDENTISGACLTASDITTRKKSEIEKEKITQDLIKRNNDLQQFTYIVSHNLRAPTVNIIALADMLQNYSDLKKSDRSFILQGLKSSSTQLDNVIKDLNYILQIDNVVAEKREWVNFSDIMEELLVEIGHLVEKEEAAIFTDFSQVRGLTTVRLYLYSVFYNLVTNSLKYKRADIAPLLNIRSQKKDKGVELIFEDNCLGIDLSLHSEKIFRLYHRFHFHREGKGMGLFMVKTQVEALGGYVEVKSALNEGTVFRIYIPDDQLI